MSILKIVSNLGQKMNFAINYSISECEKIHNFLRNTTKNMRVKTRILPYKDRIVDSALIRENTGQRKPAFSHILCREISKKIPKSIY